MNYMDNNVEGVLMDQIRDQDEDMATQIQDLMLVLKTLSKLMTKAFNDCCVMFHKIFFRKHLRVPMKSLREKIFKNMSKRAADMMRDDIEAMPPVKVSEVKGSGKRSPHRRKRRQWRDYAVLAVPTAPVIRNLYLHSKALLYPISPETPIIV